MKELSFVDQTIRAAQQSLWGFLMSIDMIIPIAPVMDRVGYQSIGVIGGRGGIVGLRKLKENIFETFRTLSKLMPNTPLRSSFTAWSIFGFGVEPLAIPELWIRRAVANGVRSFWVCDYQNMMDRLPYLLKVAKEAGAENVVTLAHSVSPVHTAELFARKTRILAELDGVDAIEFSDAGGTLTPEETRKLLPIIKEESRGITLSIRAHCNIGLAPLDYLEAIKLGVQRLDTAVAPLANDVSLPSTENILRNARLMGYSANLDEEALKAESDHFRKIALERGLRIGALLEYDVFQFEHLVPGGMMGTLRNQLAELGMGHRMDELLEEVARVRQEFGYPNMSTPYSQIVAAQSVYNIASGERYRTIPKEAAQYALGFFGEPDGPMDPNIKDKILSSPWAKKLMKQKVPDITIEELRKLEPGISDDDLLIRLADPEGEFKEKLQALWE
jgi:oxaloacetate decarboxylase alpha subunit